MIGSISDRLVYRIETLLVTVKYYLSLLHIRNYGLGISPKIGCSKPITSTEEVPDSEAQILLAVTISCGQYCSWCFCLIKQRLRCTEVNSTNGIVNVVRQSSVDNIAYLVGSEGGQVLLPTYDSTSFLVLHFRYT